MKKILIAVGILLSLTNHAMAAERFLSCNSSSHEGYTAELFADPSLGYSLYVKVGESLKYVVLLSPLPQHDFSMLGYKWSKFGRPVDNSSLYFTKINGTQNEFYLSESTFLPPAFDEQSIHFFCWNR